jgi:Polymer-forming cytoskeletal
METPKAPETARGERTLVGTSIVIKGELPCGEDLYIDGQVEGTIDPEGNRLTIGPHGRVRADVNACAVPSSMEMRWAAISPVTTADCFRSTRSLNTAFQLTLDDHAFKGGVNIQREAALVGIQQLTQVIRTTARVAFVNVGFHRTTFATAS